jgi:hypothetical protein
MCQQEVFSFQILFRNLLWLVAGVIVLVSCKEQVTDDHTQSVLENHQNPAIEDVSILFLGGSWQDGFCPQDLNITIRTDGTGIWEVRQAEWQAIGIGESSCSRAAERSIKSGMLSLRMVQHTRFLNTIARLKPDAQYKHIGDKTPDEIDGCRNNAKESKKDLILVTPDPNKPPKAQRSILLDWINPKRESVSFSLAESCDESGVQAKWGKLMLIEQSLPIANILDEINWRWPTIEDN